MNSGEIIVDPNYSGYVRMSQSAGDQGGSVFFLLGDEKQKRRILISLIMTLGITQTLYLNIPTFLPAFRAKHHPTINDGEVGIILS